MLLPLLQHRRPCFPEKTCGKFIYKRGSNCPYLFVYLFAWFNCIYSYAISMLSFGHFDEKVENCMLFDPLRCDVQKALATLTTVKRHKNSSYCLAKIVNNYWMKLSMLAIIIKAKVCVICRSRRLRRITQTEALIIIVNMRKPNSIIVSLCIFLS